MGGALDRAPGTWGSSLPEILAREAFLEAKGPLFGMGECELRGAWKDPEGGSKNVGALSRGSIGRACAWPIWEESAKSGETGAGVFLNPARLLLGAWGARD